MTNITINTKDTKKRGNGMKKILAILLAIITVFAMSIPAFAADETAKDVDNTFDNYTPAPGKTAPENWYDPYCYDEDGHINKYCLNSNGNRAAYYCPEYKRIFTNYDMGRYESTGPLGETRYRSYQPYMVTLENWVMADTDSSNDNIITFGGNISQQYYCPYCGKYEWANYVDGETIEEYNAKCAGLTHEAIPSIIYGYYCEKHDAFSGSNDFSVPSNSMNPLAFRAPNARWSYECDCDLNEMKLYRFLTEEQRTADYSFIFTETEYQFGDGKDCKAEELVENELGFYSEWKSEDNPNYKPSFGDKIASFFKNIGKFFANIIKWFQKIFGIVK